MFKIEDSRRSTNETEQKHTNGEKHIIVRGKNRYMNHNNIIKTINNAR